MFSLPLNMPVSSRLAKRVSLVQHIMSLSVVSAIRTKKGYEVSLAIIIVNHGSK